VANKTHYQVLELPSTASADEIKRAFRLLIARYHPDKVQHLGKEFQDMAAERAAELTEAYRILSDEGRRAEYDRQLGAAPAAPPARTAAAAEPSTAPPPPPSAEPEVQAPRGAGFAQERASRDALMRKALVGRVRQALEAVVGECDKIVGGFDISCVPRQKLFGRSKGPHVLVRFVDTVNAEAMTETWNLAAKAAANDACVFVMGNAMASAGELAKAIADQRRRARGATNLTLIPVDARDWDARIPTDAPPVVKTLLTRLRTGA